MWNPLRLLRAARSPAPAPARAVHRVRAVPSFGYAGAAVDRLTASLSTWSTGANSSLEGSLVILRARARQIVNDGGYPKRFLSLVRNHVVGPNGPVLQVRARNADGTLDTSANRAIETAWAEWCETCDVAEFAPFVEMLGIAMQAQARDGEALIRIVRHRDRPFGLALQLLESDRLDETINTRAANGNAIRLGVELSSEGRRVAYYIKQAHPGDMMLGDRPTIERVPADQIIHLYLIERPEQVRGATWFHSVIRDLHMLDGYEEAALIAARVGASKMGFFRRQADEDAIPQGAAAAAVADIDSTGAPGGSMQMSAEPGEFYELPAGYDFASFNPDYPHESFPDFTKSILRSIAAGLDVDYATLANDLEAVNYSSMRAGALETRDAWMTLQGLMISRLVRPVFREWLQIALFRGDIRLDRGTPLPSDRFAKFFRAARFQGRRWGWVDPLKDAQAAALLIKTRLASRSEIAASQGRDFDEVIAELAEEENAIKEAGLVADPEDAPDAPTKPADDEEQATEPKQ